MFKIPNLVDAAFDPQAYPTDVDIAILVQGISGEGVKDGCAVTAQGSPDMTVAVAAGNVVIAGATVAVAGGNVTITTAHATLHRRDLVVVSNAGTKSVVAGTPGNIDPAVGPLAVLPAVPANSVALAAVDVPATDTTINTNQITDKRAILPAAPAGASFLTARTTGDDTNSTSETPLDDDELIVAIDANAILAFDMWVQFTETTNSNVTLNIGTPAGGSKVYHTHHFAADGSLQTVVMALTGTSGQQQVDADAGGDYVHVWGVVTNGGTAGQVKLQWARGGAQGSVTRKSGGFMTAIDIT